MSFDIHSYRANYWIGNELQNNKSSTNGHNGGGSNHNSCGNGHKSGSYGNSGGESIRSNKEYPLAMGTMIIRSYDFSFLLKLFEFLSLNVFNLSSLLRS